MNNNTNQDNKELIPAGGANLPASGGRFLESINHFWGKVRKVKRTKTVLKDGVPCLVEAEFDAVHPIARLNRGFLPKDFVQFAALLSPEDEERIQGLIAVGTFELGKAFDAFDALKVVQDRHILPRTWEDAFSIRSASIATVRKYKGEEKTAALVFMALANFARKFGRRNDLTEDDLSELAKDIVHQFPTLTFAELKFVLNRVLRGSKKVFNLDHQSILQIFEEGLEEKLERAGRIAEEEHLRTVQAEKDPRQVGPGKIGPLPLADQIKEANLVKHYPKVDK